MQFELIEYEPSFLESLVGLWREAFEFGVGVRNPHSLPEQTAYFVAEVLPNNRVTLALAGAELVAFVAASEEAIAQLYVRVGLHRQGVGSTMLSLCKARSAGSLWLYAFARNTTACRFYEKHGFVAIEHGFEPNWQLEDVRYMWSRG